jgi:hypothetical protein
MSPGSPTFTDTSRAMSLRFGGDRKPSRLESSYRRAHGSEARSRERVVAAQAEPLLSETRSRRAIAAFLQHPGIPVWITEIRETRIVTAARIEARQVSATPATIGVLVSDLADAEPPVS